MRRPFSPAEQAAADAYDVKREAELKHMQHEVDRLQRENIMLRDDLFEMTRLKESGWARIKEAAAALGYDTQEGE